MRSFTVDLRPFAKAEAKVEQNRPSGITIRKNNVVRLHIPMHQVVVVTLTQDYEQFPCRVDRCVKLNPTLTLTPLAQR